MYVYEKFSFLQSNITKIFKIRKEKESLNAKMRAREGVDTSIFIIFQPCRQLAQKN